DSEPDAGAPGFTVSVAALFTPLLVALMVTRVDAVTALLVTVNTALLAPAGTVTLAGTVATAVLLLVSVTTAPPEGAALVNVTVPCDVLPPTTLVGLSANDDNEAGGGASGFTVNVAVLVTPAPETEIVTRVGVVTVPVKMSNAPTVTPA